MVRHGHRHSFQTSVISTKNKVNKVLVTSTTNKVNKINGGVKPSRQPAKLISLTNYLLLHDTESLHSTILSVAETTDCYPKPLIHHESNFKALLPIYDRESACKTAKLDKV